MVRFDVPDMSCGHCVAAITRAVLTLDASAQVEVDLAKHRVGVQSQAAAPGAVEAAIRQAGYTPAPVADA